MMNFGEWFPLRSVSIAVLFSVGGIGLAAEPTCGRNITADVVALDQAFYVNRLGALQTGGMIFALRSDVQSNIPHVSKLTAGNVMLRPDKRPRPMVLRMNVDDCLTINFQNLLNPIPAVIIGDSKPISANGPPFDPKGVQMVPANPNPNGSPLDPYLRAESATRYSGVHVMGMQPITVQSDGSFVGTNNGSLVAPGGTITYKFYAEKEGAFLLYSTGADVGDTFGYGGQLSQGLFGSMIVQPKGAEWYRSQVTHADLDLATWRANNLGPGMSLAPEMQGGSQKTFTHDGATYKLWNLTTPSGTVEVTQVSVTNQPVNSGGLLKTIDFHPIVNYSARYQPGAMYPSGAPIPPNTPILAMLDRNNAIAHTDLTAIITGPNAGPFPPGDPDPTFSPSPTYPDRRLPYREFAIHYHDDFEVSQAFIEFTAQSGTDAASMFPTVSAGRDFFAINYGIGGIGAEVWANRLGVGPMNQCATCRFEEFFLSSWAVGDPAMVVDFPANSTTPNSGEACGNTQIKCGPKATKAFFPDDPSNVYHSYLSDHTKFRILHAGTNITHVHHQHAHQWLHSPNSDESEYRDSQMISPGSSYTLDYVYWGSGNKNLTVGDSIFHCHFYPHFAQGMWSMWRVHDVFEYGTVLDKNGRPDASLAWNRALPDGEIPSGTPTPAVVPLPTYAMAPMPARVKVCTVAGAADFAKYSGSTCPVSPPPNAVIGYKALVNDADLAAGMNPGYPFFVPGLAGQRPPAPPLDFATDGGQVLDGGLPRHVMMKEQGTLYEKHNQLDFSKFNDKLLAIEVDQLGTNVEQAAMTYHEAGTHPSFTSGGVAKNFFTNGQPRVSGAPYANPGVELDRTPVPPGNKIVYKAADIQTNVVLNKKGWHYPQQRMLSLWEDVENTVTNQKRPEPLFFRVNSGDVVEYWHTNLVPNYFELDDFQVRTPTDILGQHIHLVKFDVTSSDGAANGFNYEDGTLSPDEVRDLIGSVNKNGGLFSTDGSTQNTLTAKAIPAFSSHPEWLGAQATIQRWYADPLLDNVGKDRTMRTVFTHDHFGPSTHQQIGLYAGLVIEPRGSTWLNAENGTPLGGRADGGPTSWQAVIQPLTTGSSAGVPYREFLLEFQDRQLAYTSNSPSTPKPYVRYPQLQPPPAWGWLNPNTAIKPPLSGTPELVTKQTSEGTFSLNYSSEPVPYRVACPNLADPRADLAHVFQSINRCDPALNVQPAAGTTIPSSTFTFPPPQKGVLDQDPYTPVLRAFEGEHVQIRNLVGAHMLPHSYNVHGLKWLFEPAFKNSGFRSTQGMSLSEHYELLLQLPKTNATQQADYLYAPSSGTDGLTGGNWGLIRAYKSGPQQDLFPVPAATGGQEVAGCSTADRRFDITAVFARNALNGPVVYNARGVAGQPGVNQIQDWNALMYVRSDDLDGSGKLKPGVPVEPLILRAAAGECIEVTLRNNLLPIGTPMNAGQTIQMIGRPSAQDVTMNTSHEVGLHAQLVSFDVTQDNGVNIGTNPSITVTPGNSTTFHWYAGTIQDPGTGPVKTPVEFGAISLSPSDPMMQHPYGLVGGLVVEPAGSTWNEDSNSRASAVVTKADASKFREFVAVFHDDLAALQFAYTYRLAAVTESGVVQWKTFAGPNDQTGTKLTAPLHLQPGDTVAVSVKSGFHGLTFLNGDDARKVFKFVGGVQLQSQSSIGPNALGTPGQTVGTGQNPAPVLLAVLQVKPASEFQGVTSVPFECTISKQNMTGAFAIDVGPPDNLTLAGAVQGGSVVWLQNGNPRVNGSVTPIKPGMQITVSVQNGTHGIEFLGNDNADAKAKMEAIFDLTPGGPAFKNQGTKGWGTDGTAGPAQLATLTVKNNIPPDIVSIDFQCTVHTTQMAGRFVIDLSDTFSPPSTVPSGVSSAINYRTEPFQYRFTNPSWLENSNPQAPGGIARVLTDALVGGDPQTPVFAAPMGMPVRMRMLHPAGTSEEIITMHGQVWQEEPYTADSTQIGNNDLSQATGSRDTFGANASFDMVLDHKAGGAFSFPGDYLFRTFIGNDFMDGMWGLVRVGDPDADIVRVTRFQQVTPIPGSSKPRILVTGVNTVNTTSGKMAATDTVFAGEGPGKKKIADVSVDPMNGTWQLEADVAGIPVKVTVVSTEGGSFTAAQQMTPSVPQPYTLQYTGDKPGQDEKTLFRPERPQTSPVKGEAMPHNQ